MNVSHGGIWTPIDKNPLISQRNFPKQASNSHAFMHHTWKSEPTRRQRRPTVWKREAGLRLSPERAGGRSREQDGRASRSGSAAYPLSYCRQKGTTTIKNPFEPSKLNPFYFPSCIHVFKGCANNLPKHLWGKNKLSSRIRNCNVAWKFLIQTDFFIFHILFCFHP